jgi:hypothetical protein
VIRVATATAAGLFVVAGCGGGGGDGDGSGGGGGGGRSGGFEIALIERNGSGESGTAELTPNGAVTDILVTTGGLAAGVPNPAGIYKGTCDDIQGKPAYKLPALQEGLSATTVDVSLDELKTGYVINVHKSDADDTSVACGEIKEPAE